MINFLCWRNIFSPLILLLKNTIDFSCAQVCIIMSFKASYYNINWNVCLFFTGFHKKRLVIPDFGDGFGGFDRFPFDDIPPEFREHFPSHWNRSRYGAREEPPQQTQQNAPQSPPAHQQTTATQTEQEPEQGPSEPIPQAHLPQYGLRNTVDLGQKSAADPSLVDADERNQRSMSAPPDSCASPNQSFKMSGQNHQEQPHGEQHANVRHIPIFVEGRDEPVINKSVDHGTHFGDTKPAFVPPQPQPQQPHIDREQYFADDGPVGYHHPPNFARAFGTPFNKGFRQGPQPFMQQKAYPQAFARGASPQRSQSPKPQMYPEEHFAKVPVHHEQSAPKTEPPSRTQQRQPPQQQQPPPAQQKQPPPQQPKQATPQPAPQREQTPPQPKQAPVSNDPITQILSIQTDVLNLMTEVENFAGTKNDKKYLFLDEMLTRNLIKLDTIETDGKENIRQARKEAIKCIQKCIAVLEAKAESNSNQNQQQDVEMKEEAQPAAAPVTENGEVETKEVTKDETQTEPQVQAEQTPQAAPAAQDEKTESKVPEVATEATVADDKLAAAPASEKEAVQAEAADTRPEDKPVADTAEQKEEGADKNSAKAPKEIKKRNKSKDNKKDAPVDSNKQEKAEDSLKDEKSVDDIMQVDDKGDKPKPQVMEVDGAASQ